MDIFIVLCVKSLRTSSTTPRGLVIEDKKFCTLVTACLGVDHLFTPLNPEIFIRAHIHMREDDETGRSYVSYYAPWDS